MREVKARRAMAFAATKKPFRCIRMSRPGRGVDEQDQGFASGWRPEA